MDQTPQQPDTSFNMGGSNGNRDLDAPDAERCADRLAVASERMQSLLHTQIHTLQGVLNRIDELAQQISEYEAKSLELEQQRVKWEQQQELEAKRMAEDARLLSEAWDRIEEERRNNLTIGNAPEVTYVDSLVNPDTQSQSNEKAPPPVTDTDLFDLGVPALTQTPAVQFQQMKREIRQHARRNR